MNERIDALIKSCRSWHNESTSAWYEGNDYRSEHCREMMHCDAADLVDAFEEGVKNNSLTEEEKQACSDCLWEIGYGDWSKFAGVKSRNIEY